jgi:DNA mismatch repair protein MutS
MDVLEKDGGIIFLRKLKEGPTAESYGIHVARLAGLSPNVLERAERIMERLREREFTLTVNPIKNAVNSTLKSSKEKKRSDKPIDSTPSLFD